MISILVTFQSLYVLLGGNFQMRLYCCHVIVIKAVT